MRAQGEGDARGVSRAWPDAICRRVDGAGLAGTATLTATATATTTSPITTPTPTTPTTTTSTLSQLIRYNEYLGAAQTMAEMGAPNADSAWSLNVLESRHIALCEAVRAVVVSAPLVFSSSLLLRT